MWNPGNKAHFLHPIFGEFTHLLRKKGMKFPKITVSKWDSVVFKKLF